MRQIKKSTCGPGRKKVRRIEIFISLNDTFLDLSVRFEQIVHSYVCLVHLLKTIHHISHISNASFWHDHHYEGNSIKVKSE